MNSTYDCNWTARKRKKKKEKEKKIKEKLLYKWQLWVLHAAKIVIVAHKKMERKISHEKR